MARRARRSSPSAPTTASTSATRRSSPRSASWPPSADARSVRRHLRPPPGQRRAARVGAAAAHRPRPEARAARRDRRRRHGRACTFDEARANESPEDFVRGGARRRAGHAGRRRRRGLPLRPPPRGATSPLLRELGRARRTSRSCRCALVARADGVDEPVSSTAIRRALAGGEVDVAAQLLGRPYEVRGIGRRRRPARPPARLPDRQRRGAERQCACRPTACTPAGTSGPTARVHPCAINLGRRPTFYEHADHSLLEAHLLDFDDDLYGERAEVRFRHFLRSERKFDGIDALVAQLKHDVESTRRVLGA